MSVSTKTKDAARAMGEDVTNRHYVVRHRCPFCRKPYAKRMLFIAHMKGCPRRTANLKAAIR